MESISRLQIPSSQCSGVLKMKTECELYRRIFLNGSARGGIMARTKLRGMRNH